MDAPLALDMAYLLRLYQRLAAAETANQAALDGLGSAASRVLPDPFAGLPPLMGL